MIGYYRAKGALISPGELPPRISLNVLRTSVTARGMMTEFAAGFIA
jgi:hypothetical protein